MKPDYKKNSKQEYLYKVIPFDPETERKCGSFTSKDPLSVLEGIVNACKNDPGGVCEALVCLRNPKHEGAECDIGVEWYSCGSTIVRYMTGERATRAIFAVLKTAKNDKEKLELLKTLELVQEHGEMYAFKPKKRSKKKRHK